MNREIKLNDWTEILNKVKEMVAQDSSWKIQNEYWDSPTQTFGADGSYKETKKSRQGARLVKIGGSVDIFCETENLNVLIKEGKKAMDEYLKNSAELNKIIGRCENKSFVPPPPKPEIPQPPSKPNLSTPPTPINDKNNQPVIWSSRFAGCHSLEIAKKYLSEYYQEHQSEVKKNPDFSRWVKVVKEENIFVYIGNPPPQARRLFQTANVRINFEFEVLFSTRH